MGKKGRQVVLFFNRNNKSICEEENERAMPDAITTGRFPPFIKSKNKVGQRPFISLHPQCDNNNTQELRCAPF